MRSPKDSSRQFDRFRRYISDRVTLWSMLLVLTVAGTLPALLAGATAAREGESLATSVDSKAFVEPMIQPLGAVPTFTVNSIGNASDTNTADNVCDSDPAPNEQCTMRAAIQQANATAGDDTIDFDATVFAGATTIYIPNGLPDISTSMNIVGRGESLLTLRGRNSDDTGGGTRLFTINTGTTVTLEAMTLSGSFTNNGGAIRNNGGTLTVTHVTFSGNTALNTSLGGAIYNAGTTTVNNSTFTGNTAGGSGGALYGQDGTVRVSNSTFTNNTSNATNTATGGGAIYMNTGTSLRVIDSSITANNVPSGGYGGGIMMANSPAVITNSTFSGNTATGGGGIYTTNPSAIVTVTNSTISGNAAAAGLGGGIRRGANSTLTLRNTIVANSTSGGDCSTVITAPSFANSLVEDGTCSVVNGSNGNKTGDPALGVLTNGYFPLTSGSSSLDAGNNNFLSEATTGVDYNGDGDTDDTLTTDQAGENRIFNTTVDMGATEFIMRDFMVDRADDTVVDDCTSTADDCTLRGAITLANALAGTDIITFDATVFAGAQTITLGSALPNITTPMTIDGSGTGGVTISGVDTHRPFFIQNATATLQDLTILDGAAPGSQGGGVHIASASSVTLRRVTVTSSTANFGGGVYNLGGSLFVFDSTIIDNHANNNGGGILNTGVMYMLNSAVLDNSANSQGGGVMSTSSANLTNVTVTGNSANTTAGMYFSNGTSTLTNVTVSGNIASNQIGGVQRFSGNLNVRNSIFANNTGVDCYNSMTVVNSLVETQDGAFPCGVTNGVNGNILGQDPQLGTRAAGGYYPLEVGSPARDAGNNFFVSEADDDGAGTVDSVIDFNGDGDNTDILTTDEAGNPRIISTIVDMGAVEGSDITPPTVSSIVRASANPTNPNTIVAFTVTFTESVTGVDAADFVLTATSGTHYGVSVTGVTGTGDTRTVTVNTGIGSGTLRLDVTDDDSIADAANNKLGGTAAGNGNFTAGEAYTVNVVNTVSSLLVTKVADTNDGACDADCSLREAISVANADPAPETINFDLAVFSAPGPHVIQLTSALPDLASGMTINGPSASLLTVRGESSGNSYRIFIVVAFVEVNISGLTVTNGQAAFGAIGGGNINGDHGGGIRNDGTLTLTGVAVSGNRAGNGGGSATLGGSGGDGGGIYNVGTLTITDSTISGNQFGSGGNATDPPFTSGQTGSGGGIHNVGTLTISNSTISSNITPDVTGGGGFGGGINNLGPLTVSNSTITANLGNGGGGICNSGGGIVTLKSTIVAGNSAAVSPDMNGPVQSNGFNLVGDPGATMNPNPGAGPDITGVSPNLGPLAHNGGHTQTHRLLPNSPAIDKGNDFSATATDQRGQPRPIDNPAIAPASNLSVTGDNSDIGAVEVNYAISATAGTPQATNINLAFATQLQATVTEAGQAVSGVSVSFTAPASGASGTFQGTGTNTATVTTDGSGVATAPVFTANGIVGSGSYNVIASIGTSLPTASFSLTNSNPPPTITAASGLSRQQGSAATNSQIATVTDDGGNGSVAVTVISANPSNGVTISNIENAGGNITADIVADCTATNASFTLEATDGSSIVSDTLIVTVTANTAPSLTYTSPQTASFNGSLTVTPTSASDNGTVSYQLLAGHGLTTAPTVDSSGVVSITNAQPAGAHTITVRATDDCGLMTDASFTLNVLSPAALSGTKTVSGPFNEGSTVTYTIVLSNSGPAAQLDNSGNEFTDVLPAALTLASASATSGTTTTAANTVNWNGSIPVGSSVTITIAATINDVSDGAVVSNQGTISYDADGNDTNEASRLTDDPAVAGASDPTSFAVVSKPELTITKSHVGNFSAGQVGATYTITVSNVGTGITSGLVTVTDVVPVGLTPTGPNGLVNGWNCVMNGQTVTCTRSDVLASGGASYPAINLTVNMANPAPLNVTNTATVAGGGDVNPNNNTASDPTAVNCTPGFALNNTSPLMISRFRENGPAGPQDEFVEIYNPSTNAHMVASGICGGSGGYGVYASAGNGTTSNTATLVCYIPNGTVIPAGGYYLCTGATYSLGNLGRNGGAAGATATGDAPVGCGGTCGANIPDDAGLVLLNQSQATLSPPGGFNANALPDLGIILYDKVGFEHYGVGAPAPTYPSLAATYCEGSGCLKPVGDASTGAACANPTGLFPVFPAPPACYGLAGQYQFLRRQTTFDANLGTLHQDTNNNGNDFILVTPNPAENLGLGITGVFGVTGVLGAAGPYNTNAPPDMPAVKLTRTPFDGTNQLGPLNLERRFLPDPTVADLANNPVGTLTLRFKYTNNSGSPINGLRFELDNLSTLCGPQTGSATLATGDARNVGSSPDCAPNGFTAVLKALNSATEVVIDSGGTARTVLGTVMEDLSVGAAPGAAPLSPHGGGIDSALVINPSSVSATMGDGVTGGIGNFATTIGITDPSKVIRVQLKFGVVRSGRFILLIVPMAKTSPVP